MLQQKLEREIEESALVEGSFDVKIEKAYADIGQRVADSNLLRSGHVSVTMWESDKKEDFYNDSLARIPDLLRDLHACRFVVASEFREYRWALSLRRYIE